jgi:MoxR-like ATPase
VEKEETFDIPSAARDRFMMEIPIAVPTEPAVREALMFNPKFHDVDALVGTVEAEVLQFDQLNAFARIIQNSVDASPTLRRYALDLWTATKSPELFGVKVNGVEMSRLIISGASPRGVSMLLSAARVNAWLNNREAVVPEDIHAVFHETIAHRLVFSPVYEMRRTEIARELLSGIISSVSAP